jgi:hypothetical protein
MFAAKVAKGQRKQRASIPWHAIYFGQYECPQILSTHDFLWGLELAVLVVRGLSFRKNLDKVSLWKKTSSINKKSDF